MSMMCHQCEQAANGGCHSKIGVCGKDERVSALQDGLIHVLKGIAFYANESIKLGEEVAEKVNEFIAKGLFTTVTNVSFDEDRLVKDIFDGVKYRNMAKDAFLSAFKKNGGKEFDGQVPDAALWSPESDKEGLIAQSLEVGIMAGDMDEDVRSLKEITLYGLKGMAAYDDHARVLGQTDESVEKFFIKALATMLDDSLNGDELTALALECGTVNLKCMELLDAGNTGTYGHPEPTPVTVGVKKGSAIIVSGHDLHDLKMLLEQSEGKGVNVYTHSEMLPCLAYPELKKYKHLVGNYGTAWQNQQKEFDGIPAAILFTTNCIQKPKDSYKDNVFTTGLVAWPDVKHIGENDNGEKDFSALIDKAISLGGFTEERVDAHTMTGFGRNAVLSVADKVIAAVKSGDIKHFFLIGGCDGAKPGRNYYTEFAEKLPKDTIILTLACGKFRFNTLEFGDIGGIPRMLDVGQCNDAYSAIKIAVALAEAFECSVNDLPLSMILSWYEQKAVVILLTLFSLGIKNIKLGPTLPQFITPNVLNVLVENFSIAPISTAEEDIKAALDS